MPRLSAATRFCASSSEPPANSDVEKRAVFGNRLLPYALLLPQLVITFVFFYWPASQAVKQSFMLEDAFGLTSTFVGLENYAQLFRDIGYLRAVRTTAVFSLAVTLI